jgi:hypothetical protein
MALSGLLYELLAPQFLLGIRFPVHIDRYLSLARVERVRTAAGENGIVYTGDVVFGPADDGVIPTHHVNPGGGILRWEDARVSFRLTVPRDGASFIAEAAGALASLGEGSFSSLFDGFGAVELADGPPVVATDYPGVRFRLELMFSTLSIHLGGDWEPGRIGPDRRVVADRTVASHDVKLVLPTVVLVYEQGDDVSQAPDFEVRSWGSSGFDAPADLQMGEVVRMEPPIALHRSGKFAFALDQVIVDLSEDNTPPEILAKFGVDESFQGVYCRSVRVYVVDEGKSWGFHVGVDDCLVSLSGEVSFEASLDIFGPDTEPTFRVRFFDGSREVEGVAPGGSVTLPQSGVVHVEVTGGTPPYQIQVNVAGSDRWNASERRAPLTAVAAGEHELTVRVAESGGPSAREIDPQSFRMTVVPAAAETGQQDGAPADQPPQPMRPLALEPPTLAPPAGFHVRHTDSVGTREHFLLEPAAANVVFGGAAVPVSDGRFFIDVPEGTPATTLSITWPATSGAEESAPPILFELAKPADREESRYVNTALGRANVGDGVFKDSVLGRGGAPGLRERLLARMPTAPRRVTLHARASNTGRPGWTEQNDRILSERRLSVAQEILLATGFVVEPTSRATGREDAPLADHTYQRVEITYTPSVPGASYAFAVSRPGRDAPAPAPATETPAPSRPPDPEQNRPPSVFRRIGLRIRLERNDLVLFEITGSLDFETELEGRLRQGIQDQAVGAGTSTPAGLDNARLNGRSQESAGPDDGVVDFGLTFIWDTATFTLSQVLYLRSGLRDSDGLWHMDAHTRAPGEPVEGGSPPEPVSAELRLKDTLGAVAIFAPVVNELAARIEPEEAGGWIAAGVSLVLPAAIGALGLIQTKRLVLYGGEARARQHIPPDDDFTFTDFGLLFDYGVEFFINIRFSDEFRIVSTRALKVRYKAVGFNLQFDREPTYVPIFDTSKGYEIDLRDPGLFRLPDPLGQIIAILGARIARVNPIVLEAELGMRANLGIITVDRFYIRWEVEPLGFPVIVPSGISVDIPNTLKGKGFVRILEDGFEGGIDLTVVPVKLRVQADVGVREAREGERTATAFFLGMALEFPSPIVLGATGLGIYGFVGLFAMHYQRTERNRESLPPGVGPALDWLRRAQGQPQRLQAPGGEALWEPKLDQWAFGVGLIAGTIEGGFLVNFRGALVLELPGPRLLILVKIQIITVLPSMDEGELTVGILGVIDISPDALTVGVLVHLEIEELLKLSIPIEIFFNFHDPNHYHLWVGTLEAPASAEILGVVRAHAYFMIDGKGIENFPGPTGPRRLPGLAVATGFNAAIVLGSTDIGLYLRVTAGCDMGISFSPWYIAGRIYLLGELRLFIVSIAAEGHLAVEVGEDLPVYVHGTVCGHVDLFFFSVSGCVEFTINSPPPAPPPPDLVTGVWIQSHAPVLTVGQGGERPIDASLGNALPVRGDGTVDLSAAEVGGSAASVAEGLLVDPTRSEAAGTFDGAYLVDSAGAFRRIARHRYDDPAEQRGARFELAGAGTPASGAYAIVNAAPIDSVLVVQLFGSPRLAPSLVTFTEALTVAPGLTGAGWIATGGERSVRYEMRRVELLAGSSAAGFAQRPPATWRRSHPSGEGGQDASIDLALMSRVPVTGERALERSTELNERITQRWDALCAPVAPPACVLWTFCGQPIGTSGDGWKLVGTAAPDPPGTRRDIQPDVELLVEEPDTSGEIALLAAIFDGLGLPNLVPPSVLGTSLGRVDTRCQRALRLPYLEDPAEIVQALPLPTADRDGFQRAVQSVQQAAESQWIMLHTGAVQQARLLIAVPDRWLQSGALVIDELDGETLIRSSAIRDLEYSAALPPEWGREPWVSQTAHVLAFLMQPEFADLRRIVVRMRPDARADRLRLRVTGFPVELVADRMGTMRQILQRQLREQQAAEREMQRLLDGALRPAPPPVTQPIPTPAPGTPVVHPGVRMPGPVVPPVVLPGVTRAVPVRPAPAAPAPPAPPAVARPVTGATAPGRPAPPVPSAVARPVTGATAPGRPAPPPSPPPAPPASEFPGSRWPTFVLSDRIGFLRRLLEVGRLQDIFGIGSDGPHDAPPARTGQRVLLGIVELCRASEVQRAATADAVRSGEVRTVQGYLEQAEPVPLLRPGTTYTVSVTYGASSRAADGTITDAPERTQRFRFRTDDAPPRRLDAYVLAMTAELGDDFHFFSDPLRVIFNDLAVVQLYRGYGTQLRMTLRAADGESAPEAEITTLDPVPATVAPPYMAMLKGLVDAGLLPCAGSVELPSHGSWTAPPDQLRPLMDYTLDIEGGALPDVAGPTTPLFRRRFRTSRYRDVPALCAAFSADPFRHCALEAAITGLPGVTSGAVAVVDDIQLEAALRGAGETEVGAASRHRITLYWSHSADGWRPHAVLLDAAEPLWRQRSEPTLEVVPDQLEPVDPAFMRIVPGRVDALVVEEEGSAVLAGFVRNAAGARTLALFRPDFVVPPDGAMLRLRLRRPESALLQLEEVAAPLVRLPLEPRAPWED